jgi:hypothetical protein
MSHDAGVLDVLAACMRIAFGAHRRNAARRAPSRLSLMPSHCTKRHAHASKKA